MKNKVRPIDANATIEALRANFQQGSWYGCEDPLYQIAEDTIAEMPTLEDHFPNLKKMIPLTLEQLREMNGEPVWVEEVEHWGLIDVEKGGQWDGVPFAVWAENGAKFTYNVKSRGLHCYRRPPEGEEDT